ncbi:MAG TPA: GNAT family N-acetyltransferase [Cyclobacteriaceae bacterium]|nr:GNAT family N-acetyltransferase [Cyclobacteriaceae bacterium]
MELGRVDHKELVLRILSDSFDDNKSVNYVIKQDQRRKERIRLLVEYSFNLCLNFGDIWISDDQKGCALIMIPDRKRFSFRSILWDIKLAFGAIGIRRVIAVMNREAKVKAHHPKNNVCYLWFIGVEPNHQNEGVGSRLLSEIIEKYEQDGLPIYLETSVDRNIPWYTRFGFEIFQSNEFTYTLYSLRRIIK